MQRIYLGVPYWVEFIYGACGLIEQVLSYPQQWWIDHTFWKYRFLDDYCVCEDCEERRSKGLQRPGKRKVKKSG